MAARTRSPRLALLLSLLGGLFAPGGLVHLAGGAPSAVAAPLADASTTLIVIDTPRGGTSGTQLYVAGWAADPSSRGGTGVDRVDVYLDGEPGSGTLLGRATYGLARPDVAAHLGSSRFALSGFALLASVSPGPHTVYVVAHPSDQPPDQGWTPPKTAAVMVGSGAAARGSPPAVAAGPPLLTGETIRQAGITGSYTLGAIPPTGSNYPPGPADTGGPIYAPVYFGLGLYGSPQPFPDYPLYYSLGDFPYPYYSPTGLAVPSGFDFSLGMGYDWYSPSYLSGVLGSTVALPPYSSPYYYYRYPGWRYGGPLYCPVYTYSFC